MDNYLTIDFEEWYQGLTSTSRERHRWPQHESRIENQASIILSVLDAAKVKATFFVVGEIARTTPQVIKEIRAKGHEIGLHGDLHRRIDTMSEHEFDADLKRNFEAVAAVAGDDIKGYRAAYASINSETTWFWRRLRMQGLMYDSSVFPIRTPLYGMPGAEPNPSVIHTDSGDIVEIPISTFGIANKRLPFSGGVWFRNLAYPLVKRLTERKNRLGEAVIFYFHPWEFDPAHPRPQSTTFRERLSHYSGLDAALGKFERLTSDFKFGELADYAKTIGNLQTLSA